MIIIRSPGTLFLIYWGPSLRSKDLVRHESWVPVRRIGLSRSCKFWSMPRGSKCWSAGSSGWWYKTCITLRTQNYGNYDIFLIMGNAGFISSSVLNQGCLLWGLCNKDPTICGAILGSPFRISSTAGSCGCRGNLGGAEPSVGGLTWDSKIQSIVGCRFWVGGINIGFRVYK